MSRKQDAQDEANWRDNQLRDLGLLDEGQPTETAHVMHTQRMTSDFTMTERRLIRDMLGL